METKEGNNDYVQRDFDIIPRKGKTKQSLRR